MEVQVQMPSPPVDFNFLSSRSSPCSTVPSTPKAFGDRFCFVSAPTSPNRASEFYREFEDFSQMEAAIMPTETDDFAFHVSKEAEKPPVSDEDLFHWGRIRPLKSPANEPFGGDGSAEHATSLTSPLLGSPKSKGKKSFWSAFTPKRKKHTNPFAPRSDDMSEKAEELRGRQRISHALSKSTSGRRGTRSLSPTRVVSNNPWEGNPKKIEPVSSSKQPSSSPAITVQAPSKSSRKWRLKNFLLFRSASEGRSSDKDPLRKVTSFYRRQEEVKISSSKPVEKSAGRRGPVSAHERHYTLNRAVSEDLKKKTFLPYKQGILGRLAVNPTVHALANGFGSLPS